MYEYIVRLNLFMTRLLLMHTVLSKSVTNQSVLFRLLVRLKI